MVEVSIRPRARPDNIKPVEVDDNDKPKEAEKLSITDDAGTEIGNVTNTTVSFSENNSIMQGVRDRLNLSQKAADKTKQSGLSFNVDDLGKIGNASVSFKDGRLSVGYNLGDFGNFYIQGNPEISQAGLERKFAEGGAIDNQMDEILNETKDPVSGNTAPVGATPAEVRDDIPIMASPNEFMIDAATRRYYGTPFFENLQAAAKQGFQRIKQGDESFFRDDELEVEQEAQKLQEGGEVKDVEIPDRTIPEPKGGGYGYYGGTGPVFTGFKFETYEHPTQPDVSVVLFNGRPLRPIPEGYTLKEDNLATQQKETKETEDIIEGSSKELGYKVGPKTFRDKSVNNWSSKDYADYANSMVKGREGQLTGMESAVLGLTGAGLGLGLAGGLGLNAIAKREKLKQAKSVHSLTTQYIEAGSTDPAILLANETSFKAGKNLEGENILGKVGLGIFSKDKPIPTESMFSGTYKTPSRIEGRTLLDEGISLRPRARPDSSDKTRFENAQDLAGFKTQYDFSEALAGEYGNEARVAAAQALHSIGLRERGYKDTSIYGTNDISLSGILSAFKPPEEKETGEDNNNNITQR